MLIVFKFRLFDRYFNTPIGSEPIEPVRLSSRIIGKLITNTNSSTEETIKLNTAKTSVLFRAED